MEPVGPQVGQQVAHYRLESVLGHGGMGVVYLAHDLRLDRRVALKVIAPEIAAQAAFRDQFVREAQLAAGLDHPHVIPVFEAGEDTGGVLYLAMRFVDGVDLNMLLLREGRLDPERVALLVSQVAGALDAAHSAGMVHRDVKPSNILVARINGSEHAYLADFGLTKPIEAQPTTGASGLQGTLAYMSPEQIADTSPDGRTDVYALGCVVYQCLVGAPPYIGAETKVLWAHLDREPPSVGLEVKGAAAIDQIIARGLAKNPDDRFQTAGDLARELRAAVSPAEPPLARQPDRNNEHLTPGLPFPVSPLVGRENAATAIAGLLRDDATRLVTLTGPGGSGKTRLAIEVAWNIAGHFADGVGFVELAPIDDPLLVSAAIATVLDVQQIEQQSMREVVTAFLRHRQMLLILDNFEHVLEAWDVVSGLLRSCPRAKVLVTSRSPLRISGEVDFAVSPLRLDAAVELLISRLQFSPTGQPSDASEQTAAREVCRKLDCLPLAIELAAARAKLLTPSTLLARLLGGYGMRSDGPRDLPSRQRTLLATLDWSYNLLKPEEQRALQDLAVFAGGCTIDAVASVLGSDDPYPVVDGLVDASIVSQTAGASGARLEILETVREYAVERRGIAGLGDARARHAQYYCELASQVAPQLHGSDQIACFDRLDTEHANLRGALTWLVMTSAPAALSLAGDLAWYWYVRGHWTEAQEWFRQALSLADSNDQARARVLTGAGLIAREQGALDQARGYLESAIKLAGDDLYIRGVAVNELAGVAFYEGNGELGTRLIQEAHDLVVESGDGRRRGELIGNVALIEVLEGNEDAAGVAFQKALAELNQSGDVYAAILVRNNLAHHYRRCAQHHTSKAVLLEALDLLSQFRSRQLESNVLASLVGASVALDDIDGAWSYHRQSLVAAAGMEWGRASASCVEAAGMLQYHDGDARLAVSLLSSVEAYFAYDPEPLALAAMERLRELLTPADFAQAAQRGVAMPIKDAFACAAQTAGVSLAEADGASAATGVDRAVETGGSPVSPL
jgi:predicted ATPase/serine/threonine protein kinase